MVNSKVRFCTTRDRESLSKVCFGIGIATSRFNSKLLRTRKRNRVMIIADYFIVKNRCIVSRVVGVVRKSPRLVSLTHSSRATPSESTHRQIK